MIVSTTKTVVRLVLWLIAVLLSMWGALPSLVPGHVNPLAVLVAIACLLGGAWREGRKCSHRPLFFVYGCMGGLAFIPLIYPDRRYLLAQATTPNPAQQADDWVFTITCILGVLLAGVACRVLAMDAYVQYEDRQKRTGRCRQCGSLSHGLPDRVCPKCGAPFDDGGTT
jgi:hypothetical protein